MVVYTKGEYDTIRYCCGGMAECRDFDIIKRDGKLKLDNKPIKVCPFCGDTITYINTKLTKKKIAENL